MSFLGSLTPFAPFSGPSLTTPIPGVNLMGRTASFQLIPYQPNALFSRQIRTNLTFEASSRQISEPLTKVGDDLTSTNALYLGAVILVMAAVTVAGLTRWMWKENRLPTDAKGLRIRRVEDFHEMENFLSLRHDDTSAPDRIKIRSFKGMTGKNYSHVMATRGPGISMTSRSIGLLGISKLPQSAAGVGGYSVQLYMGNLKFEETLPAKSAPEIKKLHLGVAKVYRDTGSAHKTCHWLERAVEKIWKELS